MELEEIRLLKQGETGSVYLMRERNGETFYIRKVLQEPCPIYRELKDCHHPFLPKFYDVTITDHTTTILEEYIEGELLSDIELTEKQVVAVVKELCTVLDFLHGNGIIHRDIKPSNIMLAKDGHIRLLDFDIARMPRKDREHDTSLLGTRGYAPPEQYGFAQTDERSDIYALGVTIKTLLKGTAKKPYYDRIIQKCINMNPDNRYRNVKHVKQAFSYRKRFALCILAILIVLMLCCMGFVWSWETNSDGPKHIEDELVVLPAPESPHWDKETGIALWGHVFESGLIDEQELYYYRVYRTDTGTPPDPETDPWLEEGEMGGNAHIEEAYYAMSLSQYLQQNGVYYFAVCAGGDGIRYQDSPYVISDAFVYTGESAPELPAPRGLTWRTRVIEGKAEWEYYAGWSNLDDYADEDSFVVTVYDKAGNYVTRNIWNKKRIVERGEEGIKIRASFLTKADEAYRFTVQAYSSRPNEYRDSPMPDPPTEEYLSPPYSP